MTLTDKKISVVVPCFNEAGNIPELYERLCRVLDRVAPNYEIIFVDNNSTDASRNILHALAKRDARVMVIFFSRNFGTSQYGYSAGTEYATGDAVVWMEGDLQDPPEVVERLIEKWCEGYDVVYGLRPKAVGSLFSRFARRTFYRIFHRLSYLEIPRDAGDFSLLDRKVADVFNAMPERSRFVRGLRAWIGYRHIGIEYERQLRKTGVSSNPSLRRNVWWAKKFIFSFSFAPLEFISTAAIIFLPIAIFASMLLVVGVLKGYLDVALFAFLLFIVWGITICISALGILAESIGIIFEEVKQRPKYVIREILNNHRSE